MATAVHGRSRMNRPASLENLAKFSVTVDWMSSNFSAASEPTSDTAEEIRFSVVIFCLLLLVLAAMPARGHSARSRSGCPQNSLWQFAPVSRYAPQNENPEALLLPDA